MTKHILPLVCLFISMTIFTEAQNFSSTDITINRYIDGTLLAPESVENPQLVIMIAGSGPTDRNGNQSFMRNDMLKKLPYFFFLNSKIFEHHQNHLKLLFLDLESKVVGHVQKFFHLIHLNK